MLAIPGRGPLVFALFSIQTVQFSSVQCQQIKEPLHRTDNSGLCPRWAGLSLKGILDRIVLCITALLQKKWRQVNQSPILSSRLAEVKRFVGRGNSATGQSPQSPQSSQPPLHGSSGRTHIGCKLRLLWVGNSYVGDALRRWWWHEGTRNVSETKAISCTPGCADEGGGRLGRWLIFFGNEKLPFACQIWID